MAERPEPDWIGLVRAARRESAGTPGPALAALVEAAQARVFRFCFYLTADRQRAEDLCQESIIKAIERLAQLRDPGQFLPWIFKSARNHFLDQARSARNRESETIEDLEVAQEPEQENLASVHEALGRLEPEDRALLILVDMEERTYAEAAEIIGVTESAVRSRLHRARQEFARIFSETQ